MKRATEPTYVPHDQRPVEAELLLNGRHTLRARVLTQHRLRDVPWKNVHQHEDQQGHREEHQDSRCHALREEI
jgi:hypothetical protein